MKKILIAVAFFFLPTIIFGEIPGEWIKTEGRITEIERKVSRKSIKDIGKIDYVVDNAEMSSTVDLFALPFVKFYSEGDFISILYNSENPVIVKTPFGRFFDQYGMGILVLIGILLSIKPFLRGVKPRKE